MRRRSRAYILTEIMMSMLLQAMFIGIMAGAFYMMLSFYTRTQQLQTARERGRRVISYFDQRIRNAGLGLWKCHSSAEIAKYLQNGGEMTNGNKKNLPISLISSDNNNERETTDSYHSKDKETLKGNMVTILYAYRDFDNSRKFIVSKDSIVKRLETTEFIELLDENGIKKSGFKENADNNRGNKYTAIEGVGLPLILGDEDNKNKVKLGLDVISANSGSSDKVPAGSELLHVGCERLFVNHAGILENSSFSFAFPTNDGWNGPYYHVQGILEIYMELNINTKVFDLYVLSTGGADSSRPNIDKPVSWPGHWEDEYRKHILYVSRASWKLNYLQDFNFTYRATKYN